MSSIVRNIAWISMSLLIGSVIWLTCICLYAALQQFGRRELLPAGLVAVALLLVFYGSLSTSAWLAHDACGRGSIDGARQGPRRLVMVCCLGLVVFAVGAAIYLGKLAFAISIAVIVMSCAGLFSLSINKSQKPVTQTRAILLGILAIWSGLSSLAFLDSVDGVFGHTWMHSGRDAVDIQRTWPLWPTFLASAWLSIVLIQKGNSRGVDSLIKVMAFISGLQVILLCLGIARWLTPWSPSYWTPLIEESGTALILGLPCALWWWHLLSATIIRGQSVDAPNSSS